MFNSSGKTSVYGVFTLFYIALSLIGICWITAFGIRLFIAGEKNSGEEKDIAEVENAPPLKEGSPSSLSLPSTAAATEATARETPDPPPETAPATALSLSSADLEEGWRLIRQSDCLSCHKGEEKLIGPSFKAISGKYPAKVENIALLAKKVIEGGSGSWGMVPMTPHPDLALEKSERIVRWILRAKDFSPKADPVVAEDSSTKTDFPQNPAREGELIFNRNCSMCHQVGAKGQIGHAPSLRNRDFLALASDHFIKKTVWGGRPGTAMPPRPDLSEESVDAIIAYLRSLPIENPVAIEVNPEKKHTGDPIEGELTYETFCASCHGRKGEGYSAGGSGPGIGLHGFLAVASDDYIFQTVKNGRIGTPMQPFMGAKGLADLSGREVGNIIAFLRSLELEEVKPAATLSRAGHPAEGERIFNINCVSCHQKGGVGKIGFAPSIRNRDFLAIASDHFIQQTVRNGRPGTAMVGRPDLSDQALADIIAWLRALPVENAAHILLDPERGFSGDAASGKDKFENFCASCHGPHGMGYIAGGSGPGIGLPGFLKAASDDYIYETLKQGRVGTPMKPFIGPKGVVNLPEGDIADIITYLRSLEDNT